MVSSNPLGLGASIASDCIVDNQHDVRADRQDIDVNVSDNNVIIITLVN